MSGYGYGYVFSFNPEVVDEGRQRFRNSIGIGYDFVNYRLARQYGFTNVLKLIAFFRTLKL